MQRMILAHGDVALNFWLTILLIAACVPVCLLFSDRKPKTLAMAFAAVCIGVSALFIYLIFAPR
jgi:hypothetical protein